MILPHSEFIAMCTPVSGPFNANAERHACTLQNIHIIFVYLATCDSRRPRFIGISNPHMIYVCRMPICSPIDTAKYADIEHSERTKRTQNTRTRAHTSTRHVQHNMTLCTLCKRHVVPAFYTLYFSFSFLLSVRSLANRVVLFQVKNRIDCVRDAIYAMCKRQSPAKIVYVNN